MISFIVIGRNEGWKLTKCFDSIFKAINENNLDQYEVIYVDSKSSDDSIARAKKFNDIKIFKITGKCNAAIGRNIGAKEAEGDIYCFLDGDMELNQKFLEKVIQGGKLIHPRISGKLINIYYDENCNYIDKSSPARNKDNKEIKYLAKQRGYFLVEKKLWEKVGGMKNYFKTGEDGDFGLRCAKQENVLLMRLSYPMAIHHTHNPSNYIIKWHKLKKGDYLYSTSVYLRENIFNKYLWQSFLRREYSLLLFLLSAALIPAYKYCFIIYLFIVLIRSISNSPQIIKFWKHFFYYILRDFSNIIGLFCFFPKKNINLEYKRV